MGSSWSRTLPPWLSLATSATCRSLDSGTTFRPSSEASAALPVHPAFSASSLSASLSPPSIPPSSDVRHSTSFPTDVHPPLSQASPDVPVPLGSMIVPSASLLAAFTPLRLLVRTCSRSPRPCEPPGLSRSVSPAASPLSCPPVSPTVLPTGRAAPLS
ncbi:hypothetical protein FOMPIDRAFT_88029 [Fomitopsis schrenkii]|uniref:Uncharacterized protein n=1 Tax=Fomitopsis schrenkii TaxID=2126942 RepID=S8EC00_FOMSC|nr:hypothetical protein FOMPIDRAFT_88029 [Fomitopsis schrenkii]